MSHYVVTGLDEKYWQQWGISWFVSLREIAKHDKIIIIDFGLSSATKNKLTDVILIPGKDTGHRRNDILRHIGEYACKEKGIFAYWDADVYFQEDIKQVFNLVEDNFLISRNHNPGFFAASYKRWQFLLDIQFTLDFMKDSGFVYDHLLKYFPGFVLEVNDTWNFTDAPMLKESENLTFENEVQKVIHIAGPLKTFAANKNIFFSERHAELLHDYNKKLSNKFVIVNNKK